MPFLTCEMCRYSKPSLVDAPNQIVDQTDVFKHLQVGLVCTYKDGKTCVANDTKPKEGVSKWEN